MLGILFPPRGPRLSKLQDVRLLFSGNTLCFRAPYPNHQRAPNTLPASATVNIYDPARMESSIKRNKLRTYLATAFGVRPWSFKRFPFSQRNLASIDFSVEVAFFPEFDSLFRPRRFEKAIERRLYCGDGSSNKNFVNRAHWQRHTLNNWPWVSYEVIENPPTERSFRSLYWVTPVSDTHMLTLIFKMSYYKPSQVSSIESAFKPIIDCVLDSIEFEPSSEAKARRAEIIKQYPNEVLSEEMPPYAYDTIAVEDEVYIFSQLSKQYSDSLTYDQIDAKAKKVLSQQKKDAKALEKEILASHLNFGE